MNTKAWLGITAMLIGIFLFHDTLGAFIALAGALLFGENELKDSSIGGN
jgi:hypothetical protein